MNKLLTRIRLGLKAFTMSFGSRGGGLFWPSRLGGTRLSYAGVGDGRGNSIVMSVGLWLARAFPEAPLRVMRKVGDELEPINDHPMILLLKRPNPFYSGLLLWFATLLDWLITGNAYWVKVRSGANRVVQVWWVPSYMMEPAWPDDDDTVYISHYNYSPGATPKELAVSEVVHFRYGLDAQNTRKGLSPIASLLREIFTDDEAANWVASLLRNMGIPGVVVSPGEDDAEFDDPEEIKNVFDQRFGGDNRGSTIVMNRKTQVVAMGFNPEQMNLRTIRHLPEERVTAIFGIPAVVVGLGAGLDRSTFANYSEAREAAYESNVIPTQRLFADDLATQLLPDFGPTTNLEVDFDLSKVRVLQADENDLHNRAREDVKAGLITLNQGLAMIGQEQIPNGDIRYVPIGVTPTLDADLLAPPATAPVPQSQQGEGQDGMPEPSLRSRGNYDPVPAGDGGSSRLWHSPQYEPSGSLKAPAPVPPPTDGQQPPQTRSRQWLLDTDADVKAPSQFAPGILRVRARLTHGLSTAMTRFLNEQQGRVLVALRQLTKDVADDVFDDAAESELMRRLLEPWYSRALEATTSLTEGALGVSFTIDDPLTRAYLRESGNEIRNISLTTQRAVQRALSEGQQAGESYQQLAKRIEDLPAFNPARAQLVARTELGQSTNRATLLSFRASRVVLGVEVTDGDEFDDACAAMNGRRFSIDEARSVKMLEHPNCTRAFSPLTDVADLRALSQNGHVKELIGTV